MLWAIAYRAQPFRDVEVVEAPPFPLDPAAVPPGETRGLHGRQAAALDRGADRRHACPGPIRRCRCRRSEFMDRAIEIWRDLQLPPLNLKPPYWGYSLGHWTEEEDKEAELATQGRHYETGEKQGRRTQAVRRRPTKMRSSSRR